MARDNRAGSLQPDSYDLEAVAALPFREKQIWLERWLIKSGTHVRPLTIEVRRSHVLLDSLRRFEAAPAWRLAKCPLRVRFRGEAAIDAGGVVREWFQIVANALFGEASGVFVSKKEAGYAANLNPFSGLDRCYPNRPRGVDHLRLLRFAGRFVGKAIRDKVALPITLALPLLKHVLAVPLSFSDLEFVDADAYQSYAWVRDHDDSADVEALELVFALDRDTPDGRVETIDLVDNGRLVNVDADNKADFLTRVLKFKVLDSVRPQLVAFLRGLDDVVDRSKLAVFDYQELQLLIGGIDDIDLDDWKRHTRYLGAFQHSANVQHPVVAMFWRCLESFDQTERARLCQFCTGSSQLPPQGFKALVGDDGRFTNFTLASLPRGLGVWPRAHTCFNRLDLPLYKSYEEMHSYLSLTIHLEVVGFTME